MLLFTGDNYFVVGNEVIFDQLFLPPVQADQPGDAKVRYLFSVSDVQTYMTSVATNVRVVCKLHCLAV